jgi:hypothetical protein
MLFTDEVLLHSCVDIASLIPAYHVARPFGNVLRLSLFIVPQGQAIYIVFLNV